VSPGPEYRSQAPSPVVEVTEADGYNRSSLSETGSVLLNYGNALTLSQYLRSVCGGVVPAMAP